MRVIVLGSGLQGSACAFDLLRTTQASVTLADQSPEQLAPFLQPHLGKRLAVLKVDARDQANMRDVMRGHDAVLGAIPYYLGYDMAAMAVELGMHYADLGGNVEVVRRQETLHDAAKARGVSLIPDCGLAPGLVNVLAAEAIRRLDRCDGLMLYVGGLPQHPQPPLNYAIVYSLEGVKFPRPLGLLEAFHTGGGLSTMPWSFIGKIATMEYKTLRYPGHADMMRVMRDVGLLGTEPVDVSGTKVVPRQAFMAVVGPRLKQPQVEDLVALKVIARGKRKGRRAVVGFQVLDYFDPRHGITAMMRTTGYSLSVTGQMLLDGRIKARGVHAAWVATPYQPYVDELQKRGITVKDVR